MVEVNNKFIKQVLDNVIASDSNSKTYSVPSRRENLEIRIDNNVLDKLISNDRFEKMIKNLLRTKSKATQKEVVNISKRNYRIFL
ncbi:hypothetical protein LB941_06630 [Ligilactobacillus sp. WILCCON 0076]|uniref:Uncharacterized protein n=1 Tax=Ligilactobacillus ubinensis TaxID=2876789 RepID=A0A9X2JLK4_9LACO|nr:hypothetical protein [Ligilactobacillus ubinensis]MCP0887009.1 hypothetical protein [Ligilactobacillus ubinensis]